MKIILPVFLSIIFSSHAFGNSDGHTGKVQKIDLHGKSWQNYNPNDKGVLSLYIEGMPKSCDQTNGLGRVVIETDHPLFESVFSVALAAKLSDKNVYVHYLNSCNTRSSAWDFGFLSLAE